MAIFESFLFGNIRQKLANLVMYKSRGQGIVRGKPMSIKNPRTPEQLTQRAKMKCLFELSSRFAPIISVGFAPHAKTQSVYNAFVGANVVNVSVDSSYIATLNYDEILCSDGMLDTPDVTIVYQEADKKITVTQNEQEASGTAMYDDMVYVGFYESVQKSARLLVIGLRSKTTPIEFILPKKWVSTNVHVYAFAISKSKRQSSVTSHLELS